jgi:hypothetical protein
VTREMVEWILYDVVIALLAVPLVWLAAWLIGRSRRLLQILRDGQLCFYSAALSAVAIRDVARLAGNPQAPNADVALSLGGLILFMLLSMFVYGVAVIRADAAGVDDNKVAWTSILAALVTILVVFGIRWNLGLLS